MSPDPVAQPKRKVDEWGRVLITSDDLCHLLYKGVDINGLNVLPDDKIDQYNRWCMEFKREHVIPSVSPLDCTPEEEHHRRSREWFIPKDFINLDVRESLLNRCKRGDERDRVNMEMDMFEERGLISLLQLMFALIDYFRRENIVWGVGRGSSVSSYCLYLIGVHRVDSLKYDLDIHEFLK